MVRTDPCACSHSCASLNKAPAAAVAMKHHLSFPVYRSPIGSLPQGTACPITSVQLQPEQGQTSSRPSLTHLRGRFKLCQAVLGSARNAENAERNPEGADAAELLGQPQQGCSLYPWGPARLPRQRWCVPTGRETGDRKLWPIFVWHRHCPVLDLCHDESRTGTSSVRLAETHLRTHSTFATQIVLLKSASTESCC